MRTLRKTQQTNAASMADIAFMLLLFFMVTTTISQDKGLDMQLPPYRPDIITAEIHERNLFTILVNSKNELLVENEPRKDARHLRDEIKAFILNNGMDKQLSDSPEKAVVSIKTNRGTSHAAFIEILDEAKAAYYQIYAEKLNVSPKEIRNTDRQSFLYKRLSEVRKSVPMNISIAEPN